MSSRTSASQAAKPRSQKPLLSSQCTTYVTAIARQDVFSLVTRYFLSSMVLRFVGAPLYLKWAFNVLNFTWAAAHSSEWLEAFLTPGDPVGDIVLARGWLGLLQAGRFFCLYVALCRFLEAQGTSMAAVWGSYFGHARNLVGSLFGPGV